MKSPENVTHRTSIVGYIQRSSLVGADGPMLIVVREPKSTSDSCDSADAGTADRYDYNFEVPVRQVPVDPRHRLSADAFRPN